MPRHHADITRRPAPGNRMRTTVTVSWRLAPVNPGAIAPMSHGVAKTPMRTMPLTTRARSAPIPARDQRCVDRDEGCRERPFAEQVLQEVGDPETGRPRICGIGGQPEVV